VGGLGGFGVGVGAQSPPIRYLNLIRQCNACDEGENPTKEPNTENKNNSGWESISETFNWQ